MNEHAAIERVIACLQEYGFRTVDPRLKVGDLFLFDAILVGDDPQPIVVVEYKAAAGAKALRDYIRKLESFVWALYTEGKQHTVTAILIVDKGLPGETLEDLSKRLIGTCRVFILPDDFSPAQLRLALLPLSNPAVTQSKAFGKNAGDVASALMLLKSDTEGSGPAYLMHLSRDCRSPQDMSARLADEFLRRLKEMEDALTETETQ
jgi:hypothetical protein